VNGERERERLTRELLLPPPLEFSLFLSFPSLSVSSAPKSPGHSTVSSMSRTPSSVSVRPTRSNSSFVQSNSQSSHSSSPSTESYRHLIFTASLPIQFTFDNDEQDTSCSSSSYYLQVPRFNYLPLLIPVLKKQFLNENDDDIERQQLGRSELGSKSREIEFRDQKTKKLLKP